MSTRLFIGGLNFSTTDDELRTAFEPFGELVDSKVIMDRTTGRSRGFAFVTFKTEEEALAATNALNGTDLAGRTLRINPAEQRGGPGGPGGPRRGPPGGGYQGGGGGYQGRSGGGGGGYQGGGGGGYQGGGGGGGGYQGGGGGGQDFRRVPGSFNDSASPPPTDGFGGEGDEGEVRRVRKPKKIKKPNTNGPSRQDKPMERRNRRSSGNSWRDLDKGDD
jgi:RNA recognition motif-containing protein